MNRRWALGRRCALALTLLALTGCSHATLPYTPERQPEGAKISAGYQVLADRLRIEIDTDHRRLEDVWILRSDGNAIRAQSIENAPMVTGPGPTFGIGVGGASIGRGSAIGTGVGVGVPIGEGPTRIEGSTFATFPLEQVGPPPWHLHVKVAGVAPAVIVVGGPTPAR